MTIQYEIRGVVDSDAEPLLSLAEHLNSVNLPHDPTAMAPIVSRSNASFSGEIAEPPKRNYVFVLNDLETGAAVGTSMILGQLGTRDAPYIYFSVREEERYSATLDRHFRHPVLSIGYSFDGPTEIGGLVMHPDYRRTAHRLGMQISYVRFLFIAMHREWFQNFVLAELLPPLEKDGTSHLWEAVGRKFTNMDYREADRLSRENKEFIRGLFPFGDIYASLLPPAAQGVIGQVGPDTRGVEKLLRRIGFRYVNRVDPFDGGPHFVAPTSEITLVQAAKQRKAIALEGKEAPHRALIATSLPSKPWFRAIATPAICTGNTISAAESAFDHLGVTLGQDVWSLPLR